MRRVLTLLLLLAPCIAQSKWPTSPAEITVKDLPTDEDMVSAVGPLQCAKLGGLIKPGKEDLSGMSDEVLTLMPSATQRCLVLMLDAKDAKPYQVTFIGLLLDVDNEIQRRRFDVLAKQYAQMIQRYQELREVSERMNYQLAEMKNQARKRQSANDALALYLALPKYSPPPLTIYQPPPSVKLNCITNKIGDTSYTNCN